MTKEKEDLALKVKKLLEKADSLKQMGNQAEAEAFAAMAQKLMFTHSLKEADIRAASGGKIQMKSIELDLTQKMQRHESDWIAKLINSLAKYNLCYAVFSHSAEKVTLMGQPSHLDLILYIFDQFVARARIMAKESFRNYRGVEKRNTYIRGFLRGFSDGVALKLKEALQAAKTDTQQAGMGLMIINNNNALVQFVQSKFPRLTSSKSASLSGQSGHAAGLSAGKSTSAHRGVSSSVTQARRIG
jgi:hypothetical protein